MVTIKDEIHRIIELNDLEEKIIDTDEFQRLRRIKQLALTHLVYPSANHTRFEHSLGTTYLTSLICDRLNIDKEKVEKIRLYALLHDIGHTAFSHESEKVLKPLFGSHDDLGNKKILNGEIADVIKERHNPKEIIEISQGFFGKIVSSSIGSDRMDYLVRDSHNTGVAYGVIDLDRIIHKMFLDQKKNLFGVTLGGLEAVESLLVGRFMMYSTVYLHHTVRIASSMLRNSISYALENNSLTKDDLLYSSDEVVVQKLLGSGSRSKDLIRRILKRNLFKVASSPNYSTSLEKHLKEIKGEIEKKFTKPFEIDVPMPFSDSYDVSVVDKEDNIHSLSQLSALVSSLKSAEESRRKILFICDSKDRKKLEQVSESVLSSYL